MIKQLTKIYKKSPIGLKKIILNYKAFLNYLKRYNGDYHKILAKHKELWNADLSTLEVYQEQKLKELLIECIDYSPWYKRKFAEANITKNDILLNPLDALNKLPFLTKPERRQNIDEIISTNSSRVIVDTGYTSGTSGSPTIVPRDKETVNTTFALLKRYYWTIGIEERFRSVRLSGRQIVNTDTLKPPFWIFNIFEKQLFMSTYHLQDRFLDLYIDKLNEFKPELIDGYPSAVFIIAKYINKNNIKLSFSPKAISVTAETLYEFQVDEMRKAFDCPVYNQYASGEGSPFISQCKAGNLHLHLDTGIFEFFNLNGEKAKPGEIAEMVVTSFRNFKASLVRYRINDMVELDDEYYECSCGCKMPTIKKILGRDDDLTVSTTGDIIGLAGHRIFTGLTNISKSQVIQKSPSEVLLNIVKDIGFTDEIERTIRIKGAEVFGPEMNIKIEYLDNIPLGANGKFSAVKREFPLEF